jgi:hypothetical protein
VSFLVTWLVAPSELVELQFAARTMVVDADVADGVAVAAVAVAQAAEQALEHAVQTSELLALAIHSPLQQLVRSFGRATDS